MNDSVEDERELNLRVVSTPAFLKTKQWHIDVVNAGQRCLATSTKPVATHAHAV
jgi:hypothetical protein